MMTEAQRNAAEHKALKEAQERLDAQKAAADASAAANKARTLEAFTSAKASIDRMLGELQAMSDEHFFTSPDELDWGDVGNIMRTERQLREICDQLKHEGEYAG